jgi:hypothetical protein
MATLLTDTSAASSENGRKRSVDSVVVKVLVHRRDDRGMRLEPYASRAVRVGEVHELVTTDHRETEPGARIDRVGFLACHFPNHYNVLITTDRPQAGPDLGLEPEAKIVFRPAETAPNKTPTTHEGGT